MDIIKSCSFTIKSLADPIFTINTTLKERIIRKFAEDIHFKKISQDDLKSLPNELREEIKNCIDNFTFDIAEHYNSNWDEEWRKIWIELNKENNNK